MAEERKMVKMKERMEEIQMEMEVSKTNGMKGKEGKGKS
jgi:hypothetical protein